MRSIGVVGIGQMGGALLKGFFKANFPQTRYLGYTRTIERATPLVELGLELLPSVEELTLASELIILAVKPAQAREVLQAMAPHLCSRQLVLSIVAGLTIGQLEDQIGGRCPVVRCMPNTPALVGRGLFGLAYGPKVQPSEQAWVEELLGALGWTVSLAEKQFAAFSALCGAGPAYLFSVMQALVQAGITLGFPAKKAREMVTHLVEGSALLAEASPEHLSALREAVCSPAGLTIFGVNELERRGLNGILLDA
ncbi:MAG: pyrroline-5-carboxylate reductase, partial [Desulfovibrio sp.]|nr:pyrroline-5-carboxylate reductase [Desulfovibrio sp.]